MDVTPLPEPEVVSCFFDDHFQPHLPAMYLDWKTDNAHSRLHSWRLPRSVTVTSTVPSRFGIDVRRHGSDSYTVRLLWDDTRLSWGALSRRQLLESNLGELLAAMGTDLRYLLDQPQEVGEAPRLLRRSA